MLNLFGFNIFLFGFNTFINMLSCTSMHKMFIKVFYFYSNRSPCVALCEEQIQIQTIHK